MKRATKILGTLITMIIFILGSIISWTQNTYKIGSDSKMEILGTSSLHDWESAVTGLTGSATITLQNNEIAEINSLSFSLPVEGIESGNSIMNGKTYNALKYKNYPNISYKLVSVDMKNGRAISAKGKLTVAGVTKELTFPVTCKVYSGYIQATGKIDFKMTDFNVDPPTALMGTLKTGDDVTISFDINLRETYL
jgi:polyisoprenoid-binding protein YceI